MNTVLRRARRLFPLRTLTLAPTSTVDLSRSVTLPTGYHPTNPALIRYQSQFLCCIRGVNYLYPNPRRMKPLFTTGHTYHTVNRLVLFDDDFRVQRELNILNTQLDNLEDVRLFTHSGRLYGVGTQALSSAKDPGQLCLIEFNEALDSIALRPLASPYKRSREKNWCPFSVGAELGFLYACDPEVFLRLPAGEDTPVPALGRRFLDPSQLCFFDCGSTPAQPYQGEHLFATHRRHFELPSCKRIYSTRLYLVSPDLQRVRRSRYFTIGAPTIQFVSGMHLTTNEVLLAYGEMDRRALVSRFDRAEFFSRLLLP